MRYADLSRVVSELAAVARGAGVSKLWSPREGAAVLELRVRGGEGWRSAFVVVTVEPEVARLGIAAERSAGAEEPQPFQRWLRQELAGAKLLDVSLAEEDRIVRLRFDAERGPRTLVAELTGPGGLMVLTAGEQEKVIAVTGRGSTGRSLPPGSVYLPPPSVLPESAKAQPPELGEGPDPLFPFASGAEAVHGQREQRLRVEAARRRLLTPLKARRTRIVRTLEKVRAEASRGPDAERHRRMGELLSQNLFRVTRGARSVTLTEYTEEGAGEVEVPLDPAKTPKEQVEWHFHQYRRLLRGTEAAAKRLVDLEREAAQVEAELQAAQALSAELLLEQAPAAPLTRDKPKPQQAQPFKEFVGHGGARILVGKGARENDTLTFKVAKPGDLWLHARGLTGSHVIVPLEKNAELKQELLLDAAHLALHFSQGKGEPSGEVSYTSAKYVRRAGAPGAVTYTREKTFLVRVEPARLERLLRSRET